MEPGWEVLGAGSGPGGLALLEDRRIAPSLIFADFAMPGMNMIQFLGAVRGRRWLDGVRVAVLTGSAADRDIVTCYRLGACAFASKPVNRHELRAVIGDWSRPAKAIELEVPHPLFGGLNSVRVARVLSCRAHGWPREFRLHAQPSLRAWVAPGSG